MSRQREHSKNGRHKIVFVIATAFICIAVLPSFFWAVFNYKKIEERIYNEQQATTQYMINGIDRNLDIYFNEIKKITDSVFGAETVQNALIQINQEGISDISIKNYQNIQAFNTDLMGGRADIIRTVLYGQEKEAYVNSSISYADVSPSDKDTIKEMDGFGSRFTIYGSRYYEYANGKKYYVLTVGRKIRNLENGEDIGFLLMDIDYKSLQKIVGFNNINTKDLLLICRPDENVLFSSESDQDIHQGYKEAESYNSAKNNGGTEFWFASDYFDWNYDIIRNNEEIIEGLENAKIQLISASIGICVLIVLVSILIAYSLTRPIRKLEDIMRKADLENYMEEIHIKTPYYEVAHLIYCYNKMIQRICQLVGEQKELLQKQAAAEYKALQMQITPHFLYNSLDSINCLAEIKGQPEISKMIRGLAHIFQYNMQFDTGKVTLRDELEHVKNYCMLQAVNYQERFDISYDIPKELLNQKVVKFMLQPLVENAISHGMKETKKGGHIEIAAKKEESMIVISVRDNGSGMCKKDAEQLRKELCEKKEFEHEYKESGHIALNNVNKRLKYQYGEQAGITFETKAGEGMLVVIHIPGSSDLEG